MAGIGVKLNKIFEKNTITTSVIGFAYSTLSTLTPMLAIIANIVLMGYFLDYESLGYAPRELFTCTILYVFIFALLTTSPFNPVISKYLSDVIHEERYEDIMPCFYMGLLLNVVLSSLVALPFCLHEYYVGHVSIFYIFVSYCCYIGLVFLFYSMTYLSITKDYQKISLYFLIGMGVAFGIAMLMHNAFGMDVGESMLLGLAAGFFMTGVLEIATIKRYFMKNSHRYAPLLSYFKTYWMLIFSNFLYYLGLYTANFIFWTTSARIVVENTFVYNPPYDMATCIAMFTNISATVIFVSRVEMKFHDRYKAYFESIIGGRGMDIDNNKREMFRSLSDELMSLVRIQFIITLVVSLIATVVLPMYGVTNSTMRIYPCVTIGTFIVFIMYAEMIFLDYYNDITGAFLTSLVFCAVTFVGSIFATHLPDIWYGIGYVAGAFTGWNVAFFRLRRVERRIDPIIFCQGDLIKTGVGKKPNAKVFDRRAYKLGQQNAK